MKIFDSFERKIGAAIRHKNCPACIVKVNGSNCSESYEIVSLSHYGLLKFHHHSIDKRITVLKEAQRYILRRSGNN